MSVKIKPLKSYKPPAYPTFHESRKDARLLQKLPRRWGRSKPVATLLGTGLMIHVVGSGCRSETDGARAPGNRAQISLQKAPEDIKVNVRAIPATRIAPMLEAALENDGQGAFGCIVVSAPVFLSENEAIDLIQHELEKAGLKLREMAHLDGLQVPDLDAGFDKKDWKGELPLKKLKEGSYLFDFATEDGSVFVKYLYDKEHDFWSKEQHRGGIAWCYDFPWLAAQVAESFRQRTNGQPVIIGIFFDPMADYYGDKVRDERGILRHMPEKISNPSHEKAAERNREKLRAQVSHFVEYLKQEGVVE